MALGCLVLAGLAWARAPALAVLPPRTLLPARVAPVCVQPSRVAQPRAMVWLWHTLDLLCGTRCARVLATLPPRTVMPVWVESGCALPSRVARLEPAQSRAVVWLLGHTLELLDWRRCVCDMEGMARRCLSRSPLLAVAPVAGVPMSAL